MTHSIIDIRKEFEELCEALSCTDFISMLNRLGHDEGVVHDWKERYWDEYNKGNLDGVHFGYGSTSLVVFSADSSYVFKIQYDTSDPVDYSHNECYVYSRAKELGCEEYFAWVDCIGQYGSVLVYAMEQVEVNEDRNSEDSYLYHAEQWREKHDEDEEEMNLDGYDDHFGMIEYAVAHNGGKMSMAADLLSELGVNDLHSGNWGYRGNVFVAVDYGGYGDPVRSLAKTF